MVSRFFLCFMLAIWFKPLINNVFILYHKYINSVCVWIKSVATQILVAGKDHKDVEYDDDSDHLSTLVGNDDDDRMILRLLLWRLYSCYYTLPSQWGQGGQRGLTLGGNDNDDRMILRSELWRSCSLLMLLHLPSHGGQSAQGGLALGGQRGCCRGQPAPVQVLLQSLVTNCCHRQRHDKEPSMSIFVPILVLMLLIYVVRMLE